MAASPPAEYVVHCCHCQARFDALAADWCACLASERTVVCPACRRCGCAATPAYKQRFWRDAPRALWDRKFAEHHVDAPWTNPAPEQARRPLVLLIDDEADIRRVAARLIDTLGYGLVVAADGAEGLELPRRYHPDLVLSDALMPRVEGRELCLQLKQDPQTQDIKVVIMTSLYTTAKYRNQAFNTYRVDDYLNKPLELQALSDVLHKHLGASSSA